jgi:tetratricopeptide (TPR) repeat protein
MLSVASTRFHRTLPPGHGMFAGLALQRALNAKAAGDLPNALKFSNEAVAIAEASVKIRGTHRLPRFLMCRSDVALQLGRPHDAYDDAARAISILRNGDDPEAASANVGRAYSTFGRALQAQGKQVEAAAAFQSAAEHLRNALGPDHPETRRAREQAAGRAPTRPPP